MDTKYEIVKFVDGDFELDVKADFDNETVWLSQKDMAELFGVSSDNISLHVKNIFRDGELDLATAEESSVVRKEGTRNVTRKIMFYNLDMIISVGFRVKSQRGILFRRWANQILKEHLTKGYTANKRRLEALNKTVDIQNRMLASALEIDELALSNVIKEYTNALDLLDEYDHQTLSKPKGSKATYRLTYEETRSIIDSMKFKESSSLFGVEKEKGKLEGILAAVYQDVFGQEIYPTLEEKAAHLLYFVVKDHPFVDGCKRIGATLFLEFLNKNHALVKNGKMRIDNGALVATTVLCAESNPKEKDIIVSLIMNFLNL
ncbi:MAG: virulence protein RhuM/Fic/DOC family protein [Bacillota bacterium]|nr:virulence protein RhuM/Fic/DOC family protein [Bacillota bacterium]